MRIVNTRAYIICITTQGDELLDGKRKGMELKDMRHEQLEVYDKLLRAVENLENHYKDAQVHINIVS